MRSRQLSRELARLSGRSRRGGWNPVLMVLAALGLWVFVRVLRGTVIPDTRRYLKLHGM